MVQLLVSLGADVHESMLYARRKQDLNAILQFPHDADTSLDYPLP